MNTEKTLGDTSASDQTELLRKIAALERQRQAVLRKSLSPDAYAFLYPRTAPRSRAERALTTLREAAEYVFIKLLAMVGLIVCLVLSPLLLIPPLRERLGSLVYFSAANLIHMYQDIRRVVGGRRNNSNSY